MFSKCYSPCRSMGLVLMLAASCAGCYRPQSVGAPPSPIVPRTPKLKSFDLIDQDGQPFSSKSLAGQPWVASFFFMQCPSVCWRLNQTLAKWQADHPDSSVKFVSITTDPKNDTPEALKLYAERFQADPERWTFLTGDENYITKIGRDMFMVSATPSTHSSRAMIVDKKGDIRGAFEVLDADGLKKFEQVLAEVEAED